MLGIGIDVLTLYMLARVVVGNTAVSACTEAAAAAETAEETCMAPKAARTASAAVGPLLLRGQ